ncbi:ORF116 [Ranid herpesvirus 2]|uniref:ORF116 n=1 Tax=Ranid herpesvirus 2 TaxID=389214 RepID=Q14VZ0_9VIRU|nr:ORF116 [Ranid herpesvirus 2]ABG25676.1 ORF116 [Ranid herpesvirus 2]
MSCTIILWVFSGLVATAYIFLGFWTSPDACFNMTTYEYRTLKESYWITGGVAFLLVALAAVRFISVKLNFIHTMQKRKLTQAAFRETFKERLNDPRTVQRHVKVQGTETIWIACALGIPCVTLYLQASLKAYMGDGIYTVRAASTCWYSAVSFGGVSLLSVICLMITLSVLYFASIRRRVLDVEYVKLKEFEEDPPDETPLIETPPPQNTFGQEV